MTCLAEGTPTGGTIMKALIAGISVSIPVPAEAFCAWENRSSPAKRAGNNNNGAVATPSAISGHATATPTSRGGTGGSGGGGGGGGGGGDSDDDVSFSSDSVRFCEGQQQQEFPDVPEAGAGSSGGVATRNAGACDGVLAFDARNGAEFTPDGARGNAALDRGTSSSTFGRVSGSGNGNGRRAEPGMGGTLGTGFREASKAATACMCSANQGAPALAGETSGVDCFQSAEGKAETNEETLLGNGEADSRTANQEREWSTGRKAEEEAKDRAAAVAAAASAIARVEWRELRRDTVTALVRQLGRYKLQGAGAEIEWKTGRYPPTHPFPILLLRRAPSRKECVVDGQVTKASNKQARLPSPRLPRILYGTRPPLTLATPKLTLSARAEIQDVLR